MSHSHLWPWSAVPTCPNFVVVWLLPLVLRFLSNNWPFPQTKVSGRTAGGMKVGSWTDNCYLRTRFGWQADRNWRYVRRKVPTYTIQRYGSCPAVSTLLIVFAVAGCRTRGLCRCGLCSLGSILRCSDPVVDCWLCSDDWEWCPSSQGST